MRIYIIIATLTVSMGLAAQNIEDALRYSVLQPTGTAAFVGIGGVGGSFGGDYSTMHVNPAGLADYREDKFVLTPMISIYTGEASITSIPSNAASDRKTQFGIGNIGYVSANEMYGRRLTRFNVAVGFSRIADFNSAAMFSGSNPGSFLDYLVVQANSQGPDNLDAFETAIGELSGALIYDEDNFDFFTDLDGVNLDQPIYKEQSITTSGSMSELNLTVAGNTADKFNFGFHLGIPFINFEQTKVYREEGPGFDISAFESLAFTEQLSTSGVGINFKTGIQYRILPKVRVGLAVHSPTVMALTEDFVNTMDYSYLDGATVINGSADSPDGTFRYRFRNPWRFIASAGAVYKVGDIKGFFTGDVEFTDYSTSDFGLDAFSDNPADRNFGEQLNQQISDELARAITLRLGTELAYRAIRLRGGLGFVESPFEADSGSYDTALSLGIGFRADGFFLDVGYRRLGANSNYLPYVDPTAASNLEVSIARVNHNIAVTTGFTF